MSLFRSATEQLDRHDSGERRRRFLKRLRKRRARRSGDDLAWKRFRGYSK